MAGAIITLVLLAGYFIYSAIENERKDTARTKFAQEEHEKELKSFYSKNVYLQTTVDNLKADLEDYQSRNRQLQAEVNRLKPYEEREIERVKTSAETSAYNEGFEDGYKSGIGENEKDAYKTGFMHGYYHGMEDERAGKDGLNYYSMMELADKSMEDNDI